MNLARLLLCLACLPFSGAAATAPTVGNSFLRFVHGDDRVEIEKLVWPNDDLWMVPGRKNPAALKELEEEKIPHDANEIVWETIQNGLCIVEIRGGKADAAYLLDQIYLLHRRVMLEFVYASLEQNKEALTRLTTNSGNIRFGRFKPAPPGDMGVYGELVAMLPAIRVSKPAEDKQSRSVTYRLPLGKKGFELKLVKRDSTWKIDSDARIDVPLEFYYR